MTPPEKTAPDEPTLQKYLLGELGAEETEALDERSITDDAFVARLDAAEAELVDAYARGELKREKLERFENWYLGSPLRVRRVALARAWRDSAELESVTERAPAGTSTREERVRAKPGWLWLRAAWSLGLAAAAMALLLGVGYLKLENSKLRKELAAIQEKQATLAKQLEEQRASAAAAMAQQGQGAPRTQSDLDRVKTVVLLLFPPTRGAGRLPVLTVPAGTNLVVLSLRLEGEAFKGYRAALRDPVRDQILWRSSDLEASNDEISSVSLSFPARLLRTQNYVVELSGVRGDDGAELMTSYTLRAVVN